MLRVLDLFSGIGGFSLGLERTNGFRTVAFCEIDKFCQRVLAKHWPKVPIYDDIKELTGARLAADGIAVDVICGGFPCQDVSLAGFRSGLEGARSGLWGEYRRLIGELRPKFVIVENVPGLLSLGMGTVLGDLATLRFGAVWDSIPACAVGAPHRRDRVWIVAHADDHGRDNGRQRTNGDQRNAFHPISALCKQGVWTPWPADVVADAECCGPSSTRDGIFHGTPAGYGEADRAGSCGEVLADASRERWRENEYAFDTPALDGSITGQPAGSNPCRDGHWLVEPDVGRVAHGVPSRVDRLRSLGNAVVPQIPELIGKAILEAEGGQ